MLPIRETMRNTEALHIRHPLLLLGGEVKGRERESVAMIVSIALVDNLVNFF